MHGITWPVRVVLWLVHNGLYLLIAGTVVAFLFWKWKRTR